MIDEWKLREVLRSHGYNPYNIYSYSTNPDILNLSLLGTHDKQVLELIQALLERIEKLESLVTCK